VKQPIKTAGTAAGAVGAGITIGAGDGGSCDGTTTGAGVTGEIGAGVVTSVGGGADTVGEANTDVGNADAAGGGVAANCELSALAALETALESDDEILDKILGDDVVVGVIGATAVATLAVVVASVIGVVKLVDDEVGIGTKVGIVEFGLGTLGEVVAAAAVVDP
jgi:hypothetical protein